MTIQEQAQVEALIFSCLEAGVPVPTMLKAIDSLKSRRVYPEFYDLDPAGAQSREYRISIEGDHGLGKILEPAATALLNRLLG